MSKTILWWGNFDPDYSRNRIIRQALVNSGWTLRDFRPRVGTLSFLEALTMRSLPDGVRLVWVPCFRQRDVSQAARWARRYDIPLLFDPLISAYDKQVNERLKFSSEDRRARHLLQWEIQRFSLADHVLADTHLHAEYFHTQLKVAKERLTVVPVGAEEPLFFPEDKPPYREHKQPQILFFGSFISLQGPEVIAKAISLYQGPPVLWRFIGEGPMLDKCKALVNGRPYVFFDPWTPYGCLPDAIRSADILLGIFGNSEKASRVIPNKVYQSLACGKPVITRQSDAYPLPEGSGDGGITWVPPGDAPALANTVARLVERTEDLESMGRAARGYYDTHFSAEIVRSRVDTALAAITIRS